MPPKLYEWSDVYCPTCSARPEAPCTTGAGNAVYKPHKQRITAARRRNEIEVRVDRLPRSAPSKRKRRGKRGRDGFPTSVRKRVRRRSGGQCEARIVGVCPPGAHEARPMHHVIRRGQGGPDTEENALHLCERAHDWAHANVELARAIGVLGRSTSSQESLQALRDKARGDDGRLTVPT